MHGTASETQRSAVRSTVIAQLSSFRGVPPRAGPLVGTEGGGLPLSLGSCMPRSTAVGNTTRKQSLSVPS